MSLLRLVAVLLILVSGLMSGGGAMASGDPGMLSMALASEPSGESTEPENTNFAFAGGQMSMSGQTFTVYREYVWGPGDRGVDEILVYYDSGDNAWWCLTDLTGDLVALCDLGGTSDTARVVAQWTYDAYGSVMSADHIHSFERPNLGHKGLFLDRLDLANPLGPQLVPFAQSVYHNRNRAYVPQLRNGFDVVVAIQLDPIPREPGAGRVPFKGFVKAIDHPTRSLIVDVYLHRSLAASCIPEASCHALGPSWLRQAESASWASRLPEQPDLRILPKDPIAVDQEGWPRYAEMCRYLFEWCGVDRADYAGHRMSAAFPIWSTSYKLAFYEE